MPNLATRQFPASAPLPCRNSKPVQHSITLKAKIMTTSARFTDECHPQQAGLSCGLPSAGRTLLTLLAAVVALTAGAAHAQERTASRPVPDGAAAEHPLQTPIRLARASLKVAETYQDYEASFARREQVGTQTYSSTMKMRFRRKPFSVYLRFLREHDGREVMYVDGRNQNQMLAHDTGFRGLFGTVSLDPQSPTAMAEGRHPITNIGLENMTSGVISRWEAEMKYDDIEVKYYPNAKFGGQPCLVIETSHKVRRRGEEFQMTRFYIDRKTNIGFRLQHFGFPQGGGQAPLLEDYTYSDIRPNVNLTDRTFDPRNPEYDF